MTRAVGIAGFVLIAVAFVVADALARDERIRARPLGEVVARVHAHVVGRLVLISVWGFAGWHFFVRATR